MKSENSEIKRLLQKYNFRPNDLLGQNFLINEFVLDDIVESANLKDTDQVLEIGSGIGNLTSRLLAKVPNGKVLAIEKDLRYLPILRSELTQFINKQSGKNEVIKSLQGDNLEIFFADVVNFNFQELLKPGYKVVANVPYYITGKIIQLLLDCKNKPSEIILLIQKEVAERVCAGPGQMSVLSISVQLYANPEIVLNVPSSDFYPEPEVDSAVIKINVLTKPKFDIDEKKFFRIVKSAFAGKRKQIQNTLKNNLKVPESDLVEMFKSGICKSTDRPQQLTLEQWKRIYDFLVKRGKI